MATKIKFHLDQHVPSAVAHALRQYGIDVTTTKEAGLQDAPDEDHLSYAFENSRVLVTHDRGFIVRNAAGENHAGIAYAPQQKYQRRVGDLVQAVHLIHACLAPADMVGHVEYL